MGEVMLYPLALPELMRRTMVGALANDPTIPYSPRRPRRLVGTLRSIAGRPGRDGRLSRARARTAADGC